MSKKKKVNYINNKKLLEEMIIYRQQLLETRAKGEPPPVASNYIGQAIHLIATRLASKPNFSGYSFKDEMIGDGIEICVRYALGAFDPEKYNNPFAYFTTSIYNAFIKRILEEKKQRYIKIKNFNHMVAIDDPMFQGHELENELSSEFMYSFEKRLGKKKKAPSAPTQNTLPIPHDDGE